MNPLLLTLNLASLATLAVAGRSLWRRRQELENPYRTLFEQSLTVMLVIDGTEGTIQDANEAAVRFYGWPKAALLGRRIQDLNLLPPAEVEAEMERARTGGRNHFEFRHQLASGEVRDVEVHSGSLVLKGRWQLFTIIHDVTERKRAEEARRESEEKFTLAFDHAPTVMTLSEVDTGAYLDVNRTFLRLTGYTREEVLGRTSIEVGWVTPEGRELMKRELHEKGRIEALTLETLTRDGRPLVCLLNAELVPIQGRKCLLAAALDITSQVKAQQQLQHAQKMDSLGHLASGVAHDMNNVLGAILGLASVQVEHLPEGSPEYRAFNTISQAAQRGGEMVQRLLAFARRSPAEEQDIDLNALLREAALLLERTTLARVRLVLDLAGDLAPVRGDAGALNHAFMNLCVNAVDAMGDNGTLVLRTRNVNGRWAEVAVEDDGAGMSKAVLAQALDPYFTTKPEGRGTGLGLPLVYSTVKAHGGQMELQSEVGLGTTIRLRFPASAPRRAPAPDLDPSQAPAAGPVPFRVLLVDDDELMQHSIGMMLETMGHQVTTVGSGEEALHLIEAGLRPRVVVLDLNMPGLGGAGTLPILRRLCPELPVILATGRADQTALDLVTSHAQVTLLPKPFGMKELQAQLTNL